MRAALEEIIIPAAQRFQPDIVVVSIHAWKGKPADSLQADGIAFSAAWLHCSLAVTDRIFCPMSARGGPGQHGYSLHPTQANQASTQHVTSCRCQQAMTRTGVTRWRGCRCGRRRTTTWQPSCRRLILCDDKHVFTFGSYVVLGLYLARRLQTGPLEHIWCGTSAAATEIKG